MSDARTRLQQVTPWVVGVVAVAALLIGLQFVPAEAGSTQAPDSPPTQSAKS